MSTADRVSFAEEENEAGPSEPLMDVDRGAFMNKEYASLQQCYLKNCEISSQSDRSAPDTSSTIFYLTEPAAGDMGDEGDYEMALYDHEEGEEEAFMDQERGEGEGRVEETFRYIPFACYLHSAFFFK